MSDGWLSIVLEDGERRHVRLDLSVTTLGRSEQNVVDLPDARLSRFHCEIHRRDGAFVLRDCGSRNGTRLNGREVERETELAANDVIELGRVRITFTNERPAELARDDQRLQPIKKIPKGAEEPETPAWSLPRELAEPSSDFDHRPTMKTPNPFAGPAKPASGKTPIPPKQQKGASGATPSPAAALELAKAIARPGPASPPAAGSIAIAGQGATSAAWEDLIPAGRGSGREAIVAVLSSSASPVRAAADLAATRAALRALAPFGQRSDAMLTAASAALGPELQGRLVPLAIARVELASGSVSIAGGGLAALVWRAEKEEVETIAKLGAPLGEPTLVFAERSIDLAKGDALVLAAPSIEPLQPELAVAARGAESVEKLAQALARIIKEGAVVVLRRA